MIKLGVHSQLCKTSSGINGFSGKCSKVSDTKMIESESMDAWNNAVLAAGQERVSVRHLRC